MSFLSLEGVGKGFGPKGDRSEVLSNINLDVEEGELVAIVGYSGAGKTTLINLMAGLLAPDKGQIMLDGKAIQGPSPERGLVFQNYSLLPWLTAFENILLAVDRVLGDADKATKEATAQRYLEMVKLGAAKDKRPHELSGGMRQRVSVARTLAMNPRVLLMDEPFGALDALTRAGLQDELERIFLADKKTVVLITNDVDEGLLLADRIIPLSMGPGASLGPSIKVDVPRPRDRKTLTKDPRFRAIRSQVIGWLLGPGRHPNRPQAKSTANALVSTKEVIA